MYICKRRNKNKKEGLNMTQQSRNVVHTFNQAIFEELAEIGGDVAVVQTAEGKFVPTTGTSMNEFAFEALCQQYPDTQVMGTGGRLIGLYPAKDLMDNGWDNQQKIQNYIEIKHAENNIVVSGVKNPLTKSSDIENCFKPCNLPRYTLG